MQPESLADRWQKNCSNQVAIPFKSHRCHRFYSLIYSHNMRRQNYLKKLFSTGCTFRATGPICPVVNHRFPFMPPFTPPVDFLTASRSEIFRFLVPVLSGMPLGRNIGEVALEGRSTYPDIVALHITNRTTVNSHLDIAYCWVYTDNNPF